MLNEQNEENIMKEVRQEVERIRKVHKAKKWFEKFPWSNDFWFVEHFSNQ